MILYVTLDLYQLWNSEEAIKPSNYSAFQFDQSDRNEDVQQDMVQMTDRYFSH